MSDAVTFQSVSASYIWMMMQQSLVWKLLMREEDWVSVSVRCLKKPNKAQKYNKFLKMKLKFPHRHVCSSCYNRELEISQKPNISQQRCSVVSFWEVIVCAGSGNVGRLTVKVKTYKPYSKYTPGWLVAMPTILIVLIPHISCETPTAFS